ncbi:MAG: choice-of-anchor Q domain-containing protein [Gammaproteobacteria bacterium]|jgi:hypothetical protein|nr:hypothetical protein [Xanthomonadales bacterium]
MKFKILLSLLLVSPIIFSATIIVDDTVGGSINSNGLCSITEAIVAANTDSAVDSCPAGDSGNDTIELSVNIVLTEQYENIDTGSPGDSGRTGTPGITSIITIDGMGHTLERDNSLACNEDSVSDATEFRLMRVSPSGELYLQDITLKYGCVNADTSLFKFYGGSILNDNGILEITRSKISENQAKFGGGVYNTGDMEIRDSDFSSNYAETGGGAIHHASGVISQINNSRFYNNQAGNNGGCIRNTASITNISQSVFTNNTSFYGGCIRNDFNGTITNLYNSTFSGNIGSTSGGGISNTSDIVLMKNITFSNNSSGILAGGAISNLTGGVIQLFANSLFVNNVSGSGGEDCENSGSIVTSNNNMSDNLSGGCPGLLGTALSASTVGSLADNGCVTQLAGDRCVGTHALLAGSEAIDAAVSGTAFDQRGFSHDGMRDIGAFEFLTGEERCLNLGMDTSGVFSKSVASAHEFNQSIFCANLNSSTTDTINFTADIVLSQLIEDDVTYGHTGTRAVKSPMIIDGAGHSLERDNSLACNNDDIQNDSEFRLLRVDSSGDLQLKNIVLKKGCVNGAFNENWFYGGAIYNSGSLAMAKTAILFNKANRGAGIYNTGTLSTLRNSTFYSNNSESGGGAMFNDNAVTTMRNNTFSGNDSGNAAGGAVGNSGTIDSIKNNTFSANGNSSAGGAIANVLSGTISSLENSLFHNNSSSSGNDDCFDDGSTFSGSNNMSDNIAGGCPGLRLTTLTPSTLGILEDNGCSTPLANGNCIQTHALLAGSEAIDEGDVNATTHDQRSFLANGIRDIGAFEYEGINDVIFTNGFEL